MLQPEKTLTLNNPTRIDMPSKNQATHLLIKKNTPETLIFFERVPLAFNTSSTEFSIIGSISEILVLVADWFHSYSLYCNSMTYFAYLGNQLISILTKVVIFV